MRSKRTRLAEDSRDGLMDARINLDVVIAAALFESRKRVEENRKRVHGAQQQVPHAFGLNFGHFEKVIENLQEMIGVFRDPDEERSLAGADFAGALVEEQIHEPEDRGHGGSQFMRDNREEIAFEGVEFLELLIGFLEIADEFGVFDGESGLKREPIEFLEVLLDESGLLGKPAVYDEKPAKALGASGAARRRAEKPSRKEGVPQGAGRWRAGRIARWGRFSRPPIEGRMEARPRPAQWGR